MLHFIYFSLYVCLPCPSHLLLSLAHGHAGVYFSFGAAVFDCCMGTAPYTMAALFWGLSTTVLGVGELEVKICVQGPLDFPHKTHVFTHPLSTSTPEIYQQYHLCALYLSTTIKKPSAQILK